MDLRYIISSLFFKKFHADLEVTLYELLKQNSDSFCLFANPQRGDSAQIFFDLAKERFLIDELERDDFLINQLSQLKLQPDYNEDTDNIKIYKLRLKKRSEEEI